MSVRSQLVLFVSAATLAASVHAVNSAPPDARNVYLRTDCTGQGNCFDNMDSLLNWIQTVRNPPTEPLLIEAGPGEFYDFQCEAFSNVSLRGAGRGKTTIAYQDNYRGAAVSAASCSDIHFHDVTIDGNSSNGVWWVDGGDSTFHNVHVIDASNAIFDYCLFGNQPVVKWWDSTFAAPMYIGCGQHWFFASEVDQHWTALGGGKAGESTIRIETFGGAGDARFYGSSIRTTVDTSVTGGKVTTVKVVGGSFHAHGGEIVTNAGSGSGDIEATAVSTANAVKTHIVETSFGLQSRGNGVARRIQIPSSPETVFAPFQWPAASNPPAIVSRSGFDTFVETDCDTLGNCDGGGNLPHLMIYSQAACGSADPWFDSTTNRCRNVAP
ncbi:MAG: hypothetical protein J5I92_11365 [Thiogranum sp.]|nr:hypothetical protein [Thiogranum sp.]